MNFSSVSDHDSDHIYDNDFSSEFDNDLNNQYEDNSHDSENKSNFSTSSKRSTKVVWTKEAKTAKCKSCDHNPFSCGDSGTTKPLWQHLESAHWAKYVMTEEYKRKKQKIQKSGTLEKFTGKKISIGASAGISTEVNNIKLRNMFARWIVNRQQPFSIVENTKLIEIMQYLNPTAELVKADMLKNTIIALYYSGKQELKTYLSSNNSKISFTSDLWTFPNNKAFISATAHYIDESWVLQEMIIDFGLITGKHSGLNISNGFFKVLDDYDIASKFLAITLDNASNSNVFVQELEKKLDEINIKWDSESLRFRCFNYILNLAAQAALDNISEEVGMLNSAICGSPQRLELFENICNLCNVKFLKPILDCPTWWNSSFEMIKNGLLLKSDLTVKISSSTNSTAYWIILLFNIILDHVEDVASDTKAKNKSDKYE
ncbi:12266_t:CDS:2 [Gigaspora rosea]|nr:12266_t:CDS:2 [Gigaspora rosea]